MKRILPPLLGAAALLCPAYSQTGDESEDEIFELSPFTVDGSKDEGYRATSTLAGSRIRTDLKDVGSAITVVTKEFLEDIAAVDNETLLAYTPSTEVGGTFGNYSGAGGDSNLQERGNFNNPNQNTRVRGLARADNTRNFFLSDVPWDGYVVDRVDMQRGPNSVLFGLGSPAGIVNATTQDAVFKDENRLEFRVGSYGSLRAVARKNVVLMEDELAVKVALLSDRQKFRQKPAFDDDKRLYLAGQWKPAFLNGDRNRFSAKFNYEHGRVTSNRPRTLTPQDHITPFFNPVGRDSNGNYPERPGVGMGTFDPTKVRDANAGIGNNQIGTDLNIDGATVPNEAYIPALDNYAQVYGGPVYFYDSPDGDLSRVMVTEFDFKGGLAPDGSIDNNLSGTRFSRMTSIADYVRYADRAGLPWAAYGQYKRQHLSDPTIFNFYDLLIDGPNKNEWADWDVLSASIDQTFLGDKVGLELAFFDQSYEDGRVSLTNKDGIYVDTNSHLADGSVNPNAGRPFISDSFQAGAGNRLQRSERDSIRLTAFAEIDFRDQADNWLTRLAGKHRFTGVKSEESRLTDVRSFHRYRMEDAYFELTKDLTVMPSEQVAWEDNINLPNSTHYLGDSLLGKSSAAGASLSNLSVLQLPTSASIYLWDTTWNASSVDPGAVWDNNGSASTQSENPANYVGWTNYTYDVVDALEGNNMDSMIQNATLAKYEVQSEAAVWQGWFLNDAIVGMYGWREDKVEAWSTNAPQLIDADGYANGYKNVHPSAYNLDADPGFEGGQTTSYSVVTHLNALPGMDWMPVNVSVSYNESENFQPGAGRRDMFGHEIPVPTGTTEDKSIFISSKDNKYSLKVTDYETAVKDSNSSYINGSWFIGSFVGRGQTWANIFEHNISNGFSLAGVAKPGDNRTWRYNMKNPEGVFDQAFEDKAVADWNNFIDAIGEEFPSYFEAWNLTNLRDEYKNFASQSSSPAGLSFTQDAISRGTEYEFNASVNRNITLTLNASETEAIRNNVGGESLIRWTAFVDKWFNETNAGDIRIYGAGGAPLKNQWNSIFRSQYALTELLEGTATPEIRKWRFNAIGRYAFKEGGLKGLQIGGGLRWQDDVVIGYKPILDANGDVGYDLDNPYLGPDDTQVDMFASYRKKLGNGTNWRVQLNVRNLFADDDLIPINTQPDGSGAAFRIPSDRTWSITNSFDF